MSSTLIPGSYDPITVGHLDIIKRASKLFDTVYVAVMINDAKKYLFTTEERINLCKTALSGIDNVKVVSSAGLTIELCKELDCHVLIKGVRTNRDYEYELYQANVNLILNDEVETLLMLSKPEFSSVSSTAVKDIFTFKGDISRFIPESIYPEVIKKMELKQ